MKCYSLTLSQLCCQREERRQRLCSGSELPRSPGAALRSRAPHARQAEPPAAAASERARKAGRTTTNAVRAWRVNLAGLQPHREMAEQPNAGTPLPAAERWLSLQEIEKQGFSARVRSWGTFQQDAAAATMLSQVTSL